ncbi:MAG TPA: hypothetical protein PK147_11320, partial [Saprospiraceae bacterium]|nr:hypothetical protein [Saprospiraceae bacterium]
QAPGYSNSYNRYAYVLNNPLLFTDPSGYTYRPPEIDREKERYGRGLADQNSGLGRVYGSQSPFSWMWSQYIQASSNNPNLDWNSFYDSYMDSYTRILNGEEMNVKNGTVTVYVETYKDYYKITMDKNGTIVEAEYLYNVSTGNYSYDINVGDLLSEFASAQEGATWDRNGDGILSLHEANLHYRNGGGPITVDASKLTFTNVNPNELSRTKSTPINFEQRGPAKVGLVYGTLDLTLVSSNKVSIADNDYDFNIGADYDHPWFGRGFEGFLRNVGTLGGKILAGKGTPYTIQFSGEANLNYIPPSEMCKDVLTSPYPVP